MKKGIALGTVVVVVVVIVLALFVGLSIFWKDDPIIQILKENPDPSFGAKGYTDFINRAKVYLLYEKKEDVYGVEREITRQLVRIGEPAVEPLIQALEDENLKVRRIAAEALGEIGDERAVEPLIQALDDWYTQGIAIEALGKIGDERAVEPLIRVFKDPKFSGSVEEMTALRFNQTAEALVSIMKRGGEPVSESLVFESLIQGLKDEDLSVRQGSAITLGMIGPDAKDAVPTLIEVVRSDWKLTGPHAVQVPGEQPSYRIGKYGNLEPAWGYMGGLETAAPEAAEALVRIGETAVEPLIQALKDEKYQVRQTAAGALGDIGDERAVEPLIKILEECGDRLEDYWENGVAAAAAAGALGKIGDERAVEPLIQALNYRNKIAAAAAAGALGDMGDERAVEPLIKILEEGGRSEDLWENGVAAAAAEALGKIGDERAVEPLIQALNYRSMAVQWNMVVQCAAAVALGDIGDERAVESLTRISEEYNETSLPAYIPPTYNTCYVGEAAREALEKIKKAENTR